MYKRHPYLQVEINELGNIRSIDRVIKTKAGNRHYNGRDLSPVSQKTNRSKGEYQKVNVEGKSYWLHRLVAETWLDNPHNLKYVNHIDGNGLNNSVANLEWCDNGYNVRDAIARGEYKNIHYVDGKSWNAISKELSDKYGHLVYRRIKKGWCLKCATTIPKMGMGGRRHSGVSVCSHL